MLKSMSLFAGLVATVMLTGCSNGLPAAHAVTGKITLQGKPLEGATVGFMAISKGLDAKYRYVQGTTDADGKYTIPSVYAADYLVSVMKTSGPEPDHTQAMASATPEDFSDPVLVKYGANSPLKATVSSETKNFDYNLE